MLATIQVQRFLDLLEREVAAYRVPVVDLIAVQTADPYRVLVATILSSRTKDDVTAAASARLFDRAPDVHRLAALTEDDIRELIYPVGFYQTKARHLVATAALLIERYAGCVPQTIEELVGLPGVGRKTANLVLAVAFGIPAICVDTHVHRIMNIWGYTKTRTPYETEMALRKKLPEAYWIKVNRLLVAFGQKICKPVAPCCTICLLGQDCARIGVRSRKRNKGR